MSPWISEARLGQSGFAWSNPGFHRVILIPFMGSRAKVSEVLSGKRPLTMQMARRATMQISVFPLTCLLQQPGGGVAFGARRYRVGTGFR